MFSRPEGGSPSGRLFRYLRCGQGSGDGWHVLDVHLEQEAAERIAGWLPKLRYPIRVGEHDQTAFAFGLIWD